MPLKLKKARCNRQKVEYIENNLLEVGTCSKMLLCARICSEACLRDGSVAIEPSINMC
jgi:hypothetical protein